MYARVLPSSFGGLRTAPEGASSGANGSLVAGTLHVRYATNFVFRGIHGPSVSKPLDVVRAHMGRLTKVSKCHKHDITRDVSNSVSWHAQMTEHMFRLWCQDRGLAALVGACTYASKDGIDYLEFEYFQPSPLAGRGADWYEDIDPNNVLHGGHGTYWECAGSIMARGFCSASDNDDALGEREFHKVTGVYTSPMFDVYAKHYAWPTNVFGNNAFYGIAFRIIGNRCYLKKEFHRPGCRSRHEYVFEERGVIITHIVVVYNRSVDRGASRGRFSGGL